MRTLKCLAIIGLFIFLLSNVGCNDENKTFTSVSNVVGGAGGGEANKQAAQHGLRLEDGGAAKVERKIIVTANVHLVVGEFAKGVEELQELIKAHKGYVAQAEVTGAPGSSRTGQWKVRIPTE